jgi:hypothetical protein
MIGVRMRKWAKPRRVYVGALCLAMFAPACSARVEQDPTTAETDNSASQPTSVESTPMEPQTGNPTVDVSTTADQPVDPTESPTLSAGTPLRLSHFFQPTFIWTENRYNVADREDVQGIAAEVSSCYVDEDARLELRLENKFQNLEFEVGQANTSASSTQKLVVDVATNGTQADIRRIGFNEIQPFAIPAAGVNALTIDFYLDNETVGCGEGSVVAVMFDVILR